MTTTRTMIDPARETCLDNALRARHEVEGRLMLDPNNRSIRAEHVVAQASVRQARLALPETERASMTADAPVELIEDPSDYEEPEDYTRRFQLGLRPIHYADDQPHPETSPCPAWCQRADDPGGHLVKPSRPMLAHHVSDIIQTVASRYRGKRQPGGTTVATFSTYLAQDSTREPQVAVNVNSIDPRSGEWVETPKLALSLDDAQELVSVLQHLIAQADAADLVVQADEIAAAAERNAFLLGVDAGAAGLVQPGAAIAAEHKVDHAGDHQ